jgi:hypothetical protein
MILLTRRAVLAGTTALAASGLALPRIAGAQARTNHALLIACTAYPNLPPKVALIGPNHDAVLVLDYLLNNAPVRFEPQNVAVLADGLEDAAGSPTRENILAALKSIAGKAVRGDFVYLHLSGHGAQQPETTAGNETDGLDEIFLPSDTGKWVDRDRGVPNALIDDDIGSALDAIRDTGAFVWTTFDCCHSGSATRAAPVGEDLVSERKVEFADLVDDGAKAEGERAFAVAASATASRGMDDPAAPRQAGFTVADQPTGAESIAKGGLVAFFAAQTIETTPEMPLPRGAEDARKFGLFTYTIFQKLAENPNVTYRQLGHAVLQQYAADSRQRPTPLFEGELDARVFGSEKIDTVMQWPIAIKDGAATLPAGLMHRLAKGTRLAVLPSPVSGADEAVGYLEVRSATNLTSRVAPVAHDGKPALALDAFPPNAYARLAELRLDFTLLVARPAGAGGLDAEVALANATLDRLAGKQGAPFRISLVEPGAEADLRLAVMRENDVPGATHGTLDTPALWFLPPSGDLDTTNGHLPPLVAILPDQPDRFEAGVANNLTTIFRATALSRLAAASDYPADQVRVAFKIRRPETDTYEPLDGASVPRVFPDDEVHIEAENLSSRLMDINILYIGSDYSITHIDSQRLVSGARIDEGLLAFTNSSFGMERMIAVLTEAPPLSEVEDLSFLQQGGVPPATRNVGVGDFSAALLDIGMAPATRAAIKLGDKGAGQKGAVMIFSLETMPRG